jgi:hypothetical protein
LETRGIVDLPHRKSFLRNMRIAPVTVGDWIAVLPFVDATHDLSSSRANPHYRAFCRGERKGTPAADRLNHD